MGTITVLWMEALKEPMTEEWHGRKGKNRTEKMICCLPLSISDLQEYTAD